LNEFKREVINLPMYSIPLKQKSKLTKKNFKQKIFGQILEYQKTKQNKTKTKGQSPPRTVSLASVDFVFQEKNLIKKMRLLHRRSDVLKMPNHAQ